ncbi:MAG: ABC transporter permease [Pseudonocardia sp.]|uniref:ABC transporter permease n=1 Tax=unclassified Pseudonocardia TaxID=2619320 RepID=UPI00086A721E|nr:MULTISPECIES: ABC transporter permease [unclassified Pseudonocardia]MBN9110454.1 ABC transporter permease [Pseudonocardia sp.]ODU29776.1 MAG: hypothetical protein ABS80_01285 [Pseudonocardia sp. SCN 72-51]ODV03465.1 MAG: hypothetical protein ABT15_22810 [Pseudonocardia sp. SCN 73-27]
MRRAGLVAAQLGFVAALLVVWQVLAASGRLPAKLAGSPLGVVEALGTWWSSGGLLDDVRSSLAILLVGYVLGLAAGVLLGALIGASPTLGRIADPFITFVNAMPRILVYPFLTIVLGFGFAPKVVLVVFTIVFLVAIVMAGAFVDIPDEMRAGLALYGAGRRDLLRELYLPALSLKLLSTMRLALGYAFPAVLIAEYVGATEGIGYQVVVSQGRFDVDGILAGVVVMVVIALLLTGVLTLVERRASRWQGEAR